MNTLKIIVIAAFTALAASASFAGEMSTSLGEASTLTNGPHQIESSVSRASVVQAAVNRSGSTSLGEGSGMAAQGVMQVASTRNRADVRQNAIQAERVGRIQSGEASFM